MEPGYYAIIPASVRYDKELQPNAKLLYGEITALAQREGFCWAGNDYFAELYDVSTETISRWISALKKAGYIEVELYKKEGNKRKIAIDKKVKTYCEKSQDLLTKKSIPIDENVKSNKESITINNTSKRTALDFLKENAFSLYEIFEMRFKKQISDYNKFCELFNCKFDEEDLEYTVKKIDNRLTRFAINYCENERKGQGGNQQQIMQPVVQQYQKTRF
ncbi:helix-turn-helix domain-containing protein [Myroides marinus]|uniref:helix-turn-helix domain-containing protein n=1 Tax=Myroides marinus TaxID=703342 RepID=UPI002578E9B1|nr:helix-turn-helix domain-containing protein [Myroides marinus]MDM1345720.1 helix-turn-helix domain-containing protein [Myroides marinus]